MDSISDHFLDVLGRMTRSNLTDFIFHNNKNFMILQNREKKSKIETPIKFYTRPFSIYKGNAHKFGRLSKHLCTYRMYVLSLKEHYFFK